MSARTSDGVGLDLIPTYTRVLSAMGLSGEALWDCVTAMLARDAESLWWRDSREC